MNTVRARRVATAVAVVVLTALLVLAARRIDLQRLMAELRTVQVSWLLVVLGAYVAILPLWALQWRLLAPQRASNTFRQMLGIVALASSTHATTAVFVGEATSALLLIAQAGLSRPEALSVIAMDQLLVGIAKLSVLSTAAAMLTLPAWMERGIAALATGVAALFVACMVAAWQHERIAARVTSFVPARAVNAVARIGQALAPLRSVPRGGGALALALLKSVAEVLAILCVQRAFGVQMPWTIAVLVLAAVNLATLIAVVPGNLGVYEAAVALIYTRAGISSEQAVGMAVVQHACFLAAVALPGYVWLAAAGSARSAAAAS